MTLHVEETEIGEGIVDRAWRLRRVEEEWPGGYVQIDNVPEDEIPAIRAALYQTGIDVGIN